MTTPGDTSAAFVPGGLEEIRGPKAAEDSASADAVGTAVLQDEAHSLADRPDPRDVGISVLRDLARIETRSDRVRRIFRIWESKVSGAIRTREVESAEAWMKAVTADPDIPPEHSEALDAALAVLSRHSLIDDLLVWMVESGAIDRASGLLSEWGEPIVRRMIGLMEVDDPPVNRLHMVDVLTVVGKTDIRLLSAHIGDHRWFIVRNLAIALGRSGRLRAIPSLRDLLAHEDARVRVEALRGLAAIDRDAAVADLVAAFQDPDRRVRQAAVSLLRASGSREVVPRLLDVVENRRVGVLESERLVEVIGERNESTAREALEKIASHRGRHGAPRQVRQAAKRQLGKREM